MANRWGKYGNNVRFHFSWSPKINADGDCSNEIRRHLLLGRIAMANIDSVLKSKDITLSSYWQRSVESKIWFESWDLDHKEGWTPNNWCFQILIRLLRVHWTIRRLKQSILKETNPEYSLERLMLKRKLQYFGHQYEEPTHWKRPWSWERFKAKRVGGGLGWDG